MSTLNNAMITIQLRMAMMTHDFGMKTTNANRPMLGSATDFKENKNIS